MFYKTKLPFDKDKWIEYFKSIDDSIEYKFFGRGSNGLYQGIIPESDLTQDIKKHIPDVLNCSFIKVFSGSCLIAHTDTRSAALNYPLYVPEDSINEIYSDVGTGMKKRKAYSNRPQQSTADVFLRATLLESFKLDVPTLLNTHCPHGVSKSKFDRVVLSITFDEKWNGYEEIKKELINNGY